MINEVFEILSGFVVSVMGILISLSFLNVRPTKRNIVLTSIYILLESSLNIPLTSQFGSLQVQKFYPLLVHVPFVLMCVFAFRKQLFPSMVAVTMSYLCCQVSYWLSMLSVLIKGPDWISEIFYIVFAIITTILVLKYAAPSVSRLLEPGVSIGVFLCIVPFFYYIFDYGFTVYSDILYRGSPIVMESLLSILSASFVYFCISYSYQFEKEKRADVRAQILEMKRLQSERDIDGLKRTATQVSLLRHDMRHYLTEAQMMLRNGSYEQLDAYLQGLTDKMDSTVSKNFSANSTVNMIISFFDNLFAEKNVVLKHDITVPSRIHISDIDLTSILSNALDNALNAVKKLPEGSRYVEFIMHTTGDKLLINIINPCAEEPVLTDGLPYTDAAGHGFGTKSIVYAVEKLGGHCHFSVEEKVFSLKIVI